MTDKSLKNIEEYTRKHCQHKIFLEDYAHYVIAVKKSALLQDFQEAKYQLHYVTLLEPPKMYRTLISCVTLFSGVTSYFRLEDILGIVRDNYLPEWAVQNREELDMLLKYD